MEGSGILPVDASINSEKYCVWQIEAKECFSSNATPSCMTYEAFVCFSFMFCAIALSGNMSFNISTMWSACAKGVRCSAMKPTISSSAFAVNSSISEAQDSFGLKKFPIFTRLLAAFIAVICLSDDACLNKACLLGCLK